MTLPRVFVAMPFSTRAVDTYETIRRAVEDAGAEAVRIDREPFDGSVTDRIKDQIRRADVIVADLSGRNANVFYEVGYAHACMKLVIHLTNTSMDIAFDVHDRFHEVYSDCDDLYRRLLPPEVGSWRSR